MRDGNFGVLNQSASAPPPRIRRSRGRAAKVDVDRRLRLRERLRLEDDVGLPLREPAVEIDAHLLHREPISLLPAHGAASAAPASIAATTAATSGANDHRAAIVPSSAESTRQHSRRAWYRGRQNDASARRPHGHRPLRTAPSSTSRGRSSAHRRAPCPSARDWAAERGRGRRPARRWPSCTAAGNRNEEEQHVQRRMRHVRRAPLPSRHRHRRRMRTHRAPAKAYRVSRNIVMPIDLCHRYQCSFRGEIGSATIDRPSSRLATIRMRRDPVQRDRPAGS